MSKSSLNIENSNQDQDIKIYTLGRFAVLQGNDVISESSSRSKRMWEIFKYLFSYRDQTFTPVSLLEKIWPENEYADPNLVMRAQIFRLRQALNTGPANSSLAENIVFSHGSYQWKNKIQCWIDVDQFEALAEEASTLNVTDPERSIETYNQAVNLYRGEYLPESSFSEWVEPLRSYYHEIYINSVLALVDLLKARRNYSGIIKLCEQALALDYYEEKIHISLIEALMTAGQKTRARAHYNEATSAFYREMGIKPSPEMKNLYRLVGSESGSFELDLGTIQEGLQGKELVDGAYLCDPELFRYFYKLERLRVERNGQSVLLGLLTLTNPDYSRPGKKALLSVMDDMQDAILSSLRKGDLVTRWNDAQYLLLLPGLNREQAIIVIERIERLFAAKFSLRGLTLHKKIESILPLEGDAHFS